MAYLIKKLEAGDQFPKNGKIFNSHVRASDWRHRECVLETGYFYNNPDRMKSEYAIYESHSEGTHYVVYWEDEREVNEFGEVVP